MFVKALPGLAGALMIAGSCNAALAASYSGSWPVTISNSKGSNGSYCLTLSGTTSGGASLTGPLGDLPDGDFVVIGRDLVASVAYPTGSGDNAGLMFIAPAAKGNLGAKG